MKIALGLLAWTLAACAQGDLPNRDRHGPVDLPAYIARLESAERDQFQLPEAVVRALRLERDAWVADIGCGPGYFTRRLAKAAPDGVVFAVDVEPRQLDRLNQHLASDHSENVVTVLAPFDHPRLPKASVELILVADTYHHLEDRVAYAQHLRHALKSGGRLVVIEYHEGPLPVGPPPEHKIAKDTVVDELGRAGFRLRDELTFLPYQYFLVFTVGDAKE